MTSNISSSLHCLLISSLIRSEIVCGFDHIGDLFVSSIMFGLTCDFPIFVSFYSWHLVCLLTPHQLISSQL